MSKRSDQSRMLWVMFNKAREYREANKPECQRRCLELIQRPELPLIIRCMSYQTLIFCSPEGQAEYWLDLADKVCDEMEALEAGEAPTSLRQLTGRLRKEVEQQKKSGEARQE